MGHDEIEVDFGPKIEWLSKAMTDDWRLG